MSGGWQRSETSGTQRTASPGWRKIRLEVLERDRHLCQLRLEGICTTVATQVDHVVGHAEGGSDKHENLKAVCRPCHAKRTSQQANAARKVKMVGRTMKREPERHPGLRW